MQFSTILVALFAGVALAAPSTIEARQTTQCNLCREDCFKGKGSDSVFRGCLNECNTGIGCKLTA